ncbi:uncharacterized protein LOC108219414 isoform X1 [Daucus carota subsp. sativus]|uniref:uncharacterized protein LOC108219414 isoform X1 n=1 Tax=Daucus carota subsp. sativus TaxID=79200 RepID=UPI0007EF9A06|nr:PREDICTED: maf-like protein DDB_G0281937 isoform X1 [Daucus carota subsp. sativus]
MEETAATSSFKIILGSSSVARRKILADMGYEFTVMSADIDEKGIRMENPEELVMALAEAKASAVVSKLRTIDNQAKDDKQTLVIASDTEEAITPELAIGDHKKNAEPTLLLTCDQVVVYEGIIREKPSNKEEARQFIKGYSGARAATVSSVLVTNLSTGFKKGDWDRVEIYFHDIPDHIIDNLIEEGTVLYVAGGLIIEHPLVLPYIKNVVGTTDSVMGLPKALTERLIREAL